MADITFKEYLDGRSRQERMRGRQKLLDDFKEFKRREKVREQKTMAKSGKMINKMLTGGQAKIAAKAPPRNKIDGKDFAVLRAEGAKGRGMGLQDEKMKPGKVKKAVVGMLAVGMGAKKNMEKRKVPMAMGAAGAATAKLSLMKRILGLDKGGMGDATKYKKYLKSLKDIKEKAENKKFEARRIRLAGGKAAMNAIKASRVGKVAAGVAGAALAAKYGLEKMYEKRTGKKPFTKRPDKKTGGGIMKVPGGYAKEGVGRISDKALKGKSPQQRFSELEKRRESVKKLPAMRKKMGGGMMQRPMMAMGGGMMPGYKKGKSVMAKGCKLGRKKPTKMYT